MFSIYGWAEIRPNVGGGAGDVQEAVVAIEKLIDELWPNLGDRLEVSVLGEDAVLKVYIVQNRVRGNVDRCRQVLDETVRVAPNSYGVLFMRNWDGTPEQTMQRMVMRRGEVVMEDDDIFTPIIPTIDEG